MKTLKRIFILTICIVFVTPFLWAQNENRQAYWVHTDEVNPSMMRTYEKVSKEFVEACKKHKLKGADYFTLRSDDMKYITIAPINSMADFDNNPLKPLQEKMGKEAFAKLFENFNQCYDNHYDAVIWLNKDLSYMPEGEHFAPADEDYREFTYYHYSPANRNKMIEISKGFKELYKNKGSKSYYRIYTNGFGERGTYIMVAMSAKSAEDAAKKQEENKKLIGDSQKELVDRLLKYTTKTEHHTGWIRDDLSYSATN